MVHFSNFTQYYIQHKLWWHSNKEENLNYIRKAQKLYNQNHASLKNFNLRIPSPSQLSEVFAFCTEYIAASIFWPKYKRNLDDYFSIRVAKLLSKEKGRNLNIQNSVLDENPYDFAIIMGKLLLERYPKKWPEFLLRRINL